MTEKKRNRWILVIVVLIAWNVANSLAVADLRNGRALRDETINQMSYDMYRNIEITNQINYDLDKTIATVGQINYSFDGLLKEIHPELADEEADTSSTDVAETTEE